MAREPTLTRLRQSCNGHHEGEFAWISGGCIGSVSGVCSWVDETLLAGRDRGSYLSRVYTADEFGREWDVPWTCDLCLCR
jgi:hypothetical protein